MIALDNALKYSEGDINISTKLTNRTVEVRIRDSGQGIPAEKLEHIFDRFNRGEDATSIPGVGLGLAIAKSLTEGQGGTISVESQPGEGSAIILRFEHAE